MVSVGFNGQAGFGPPRSQLDMQLYFLRVFRLTNESGAFTIRTSVSVYLVVYLVVPTRHVCCIRIRILCGILSMCTTICVHGCASVGRSTLIGLVANTTVLSFPGTKCIVVILATVYCAPQAGPITNFSARNAANVSCACGGPRIGLLHQRQTRSRSKKR